MGGATSHTKKDYQTLQDIAETREDIAKSWYTSEMSRTRVYPQDISTTITLTPNAVANTFGNWTQIIPAGTVPFDYDVNSLQTEGTAGADSFFIQLAISPTPSGNQYLGEKRFTLGVGGRARVEFKCPTIPRGSPVYGRVKTAAGATTVNVSISVVRCICSPDLEILLAAKRTTWPW